jgi:GMP synthase-like glutamine amidotransferase
MLIVVQNDAEVPIGRYGELLASSGIDWQTIRLYEDEPLPKLADVAAMIVLGGAMGVHDLQEYPFLKVALAAIREAVDRSLPFLGICLGGQLLAAVLGAQVSTNCCGEKGTLAVELTEKGRQDPLLYRVPSPFTTFQWHNDSFALPPAAELLAASAACPHQAFRFGDNAYAVQFHPEVNPAIVELWSRETPATAGQAERFVAEFVARQQSYQQAADRMLHNFLRLSGLG